MNELRKQDSTTSSGGGESFSSAIDINNASSPSSTTSSASSAPLSPKGGRSTTFSFSGSSRSTTGSKQKCTTASSPKSPKRRHGKKKKKRYKAPRGTWNDDPPSPSSNNIMSNMSPDGPHDAVNALEYQMWGDEGIPSVPTLSDEEGEDEKKAAAEKEKISLTCVGWKLRSGLGKFNVKHAWEERKFVLDGNRLSYYNVGVGEDDNHAETDGGIATVASVDDHVGVQCEDEADAAEQKQEPKNDNDNDKNESTLSTSSNHFKEEEEQQQDEESPRGTIILTPEKNAKIELVDENSSSNPNPLAPSAITQSVKSTVIPSPTSYAIKISVPDENISWKFCFKNSTTQELWYNALRQVTGTADDALHNLEPGDHVVRWEMIMLPVLVWPIQIHGIVLEAGKNCVILADFGLTSYGPGGGDGSKKRRRKTSGKSNEEEDEDEAKQKENHDFTMQAWKKLRPKEKKRLNVMVLTDRSEIKKWHKVNYGRNFFKKKDGKKGKVISSISSWFGKSHGSGVSNSPFKKKFDEGAATGGGLGTVQEDNQVNQNDSDEAVNGEGGVGEGNIKTKPSYEEEQVSQKIPIPDYEPEWFHTSDDIDSDDDILSTEGEHNGSKVNDDDDKKPPPVFSIDNGAIRNKSLSPPRRRPWHGKKKHHKKHSEETDGDSNAAHNKLPKSDPAKIVLARTHFILEHGDELLPPYHVFHSNSECIAVWCKTGRWSTLQTSVFLHSCSVGNAKSSMALTLGVAATHVFLAPVVALGGVAFVTAPWIILKKSKEKWEAATMKLTQEFWRRASPEVFVEAIEHWSSIH